jgi:aliphatic nitrilase
MPDSYPTFKAAVAQLAPSLLNREETVDIACKAIEKAGKEGAQLIAFPESFIPGYPYWLWIEAPFEAARYFRDFFKNAVEVPSVSTQLLCRAAKKANCHVVMGMSSIEGGTLYNAMLFIDNQGEIIGYRRKLVPTVVERTIWGRGDGSDLCVYNTELGKIGGLICGENNMYLVKFALLAKGEQIHIANFPSFPFKRQEWFSEAVDLTLRGAAIQGQIFILNAINYVSEDMEKKIFDTNEKKQFYCNTNIGGSSIIAPNGVHLVKPVFNKEIILYAEIDLEMIIDAKWMVDSTGHYARPDITKLLVNEEKYTNYEIRKSKFYAGGENLHQFKDDYKKLSIEAEVDKDEK